MSDDKLIKDNIQVFSVSAVIFGCLALFSFFTGIGSLFFGGMGILFVALSSRKGMPLTNTGRIGLFLSVIGILLGLLILVYAYYNVMLPLMNDPEYYKAMDIYYQNNFGFSLDEVFGDYWNR